MSDKIWFDPTSDKWVLSDGKHYLEVPHWARGIIVNEFERETRQLRELVRSVLVLRHDPVYKWLDATTAEIFGKSFTEQARELGVEL